MTSSKKFSVEAARAAADDGALAAWVADFLSSPGSDNADLAESLADEMSSWIGPVELPFDRLHRLAGPAHQPTLDRLDEDDLETVESMEDSIDDGWDPPPLLVSLNGSQLVVEDGNHRIEGLRRAGSSSYWAIIGCRDEAEHKAALSQVEQ